VKKYRLGESARRELEDREREEGREGERARDCEGGSERERYK